MQRARNCAHCGKPGLTPQSREMAIFNSVIRYRCSECGTEVDITPVASIGIMTTIGLLALLFWGFILFWDKFRSGVVATSLFGLAILAFGFITIVPLLKHLRNPVIKSSPPVNLVVEKATVHIAERLIILIEGFGFLAGLLAPVIAIIGVLAVAAVIGFVNFTYFGN